MTNHAIEISQGSRFEFGKNWSLFLKVLDDNRIAVAKQSLVRMLGTDSLAGQTFLDIGSGSGLFSLAARYLGANVRSFDFDPQSVACTRELRRRYFPDDPQWTVEEGSVLDASFMSSLGSFDVVYSWGVLHHTGEMWRALQHAASLVADGGKLYIAIYNDQGAASRRWKSVKSAYCKAAKPIKGMILCAAFVRLWGPTLLRDLFTGQFGKSWREYGQDGRGMSPWRDLVDWVGGFPFEVAKPEEIFDFHRERGFELRKMKTCAGGHACNEFVFERGRS